MTFSHIAETECLCVDKWRNLYRVPSLIAFIVSPGFFGKYDSGGERVTGKLNCV
jgi:hypothetical protein